MIVTVQVYCLNVPPKKPDLIGAEAKPHQATVHFDAAHFIAAIALPAAASPLRQDSTALYVSGLGELQSPESAELIVQKVRRARLKGAAE